MIWWLYQMNAGVWKPRHYREEVREGELSPRFSLGKVCPTGMSPQPGDNILLFYAKSLNKEPGIYGLGIITSIDTSDEPALFFRPLRPSDRLKVKPLWDARVSEVIDIIRRPVPQGTMWKMGEQEVSFIENEIEGKESSINRNFRRNIIGLDLPVDIQGTIDRLDAFDSQPPPGLRTGEEMCKSAFGGAWADGGEKVNTIPWGKPGGCHETLVVAIGSAPSESVEFRILQAVEHIRVKCSQTGYVIFWADQWNSGVWRDHRFSFTKVTPFLKLQGAIPTKLS